MLDYPVDQNGDTLVSLLLRLLVSGFLGLLTLKKCILIHFNHYKVVGVMDWIEGSCNQAVVARLKSCVLCRMSEYQSGKLR